VGSLERQVLPGARKFTELGLRPGKEIEEIAPVDKLARVPKAGEGEAIDE
jgi:DNA recombination protein RmuC